MQLHAPAADRDTRYSPSSNRSAIIRQQFDKAVDNTVAAMLLDGIATLADMDEQEGHCTDLADNELYDAAQAGWAYLDRGSLTAADVGTVDEVYRAARTVLFRAEEAAAGLTVIA